MTQVFWVFPEITAREKPRKATRRQHHKYDHWQMLQDRLAGMTWAEIEVKHLIPICRGERGRAARELVGRAQASNKLMPHEVAQLFPRSSA